MLDSTAQLCLNFRQAHAPRVYFWKVLKQEPECGPGGNYIVAKYISKVLHVSEKEVTG